MNFSIFPNILTSSHSSSNTIDLFITSSFIKPIVFLLTQYPSLITILFNLLSLPTPLNSPLLQRYLLSLGFNLTKHFIQLLSASSFDSFSFTDVDDFVFALDSLFTNTLNVLLPIKAFTYHLSSFKALWFDGERVTSKRTLRKLKRSYRSSPSSSSHVLWLSHPSTYRSLLHTKHSNFLICYINSASSSSFRWKNLNRIFSKQSPPPPFSSQDFHDYFYKKILFIRTNRSSSHTPPASSLASVSLSHFSRITFTDLISIIKSVFSSSCSLDLIVPKTLNDLSSFFYPIILNLINHSLPTSKFPTFFKSSTPILKKPSLDLSIISNHHPIANLSFPSKILEKAIYLQLSNILLSNNLFSPSQFGF